jgi:hypothetical protein
MIHLSYLYNDIIDIKTTYKTTPDASANQPIRYLR